VSAAGASSIEPTAEVPEVGLEFDRPGHQPPRS